MFKVNTRQLKQYENDLKALNRRGIPYAISGALTSTAFDARKEWQAEVRNKMTLRNQFTERSIRVDKSTPRKLESVVGSIADYMEKQEEGGEKRRGGKYGPPIPTNDARIGKSPKKLVSRPNKMSRINLAAKGLAKFKSKRQKIAVAASMAKRSGSKFALIPIRGGEGIYKLSGGRRKLRMRLIYAMSKRSVFVPPTPTMGPAVQRVTPNMAEHYRKALKQQLDRLRFAGKLK